MDIPLIPDYELREELSGCALTRRFRARHRLGGFPCLLRTPIDQGDSAACHIIQCEARLGLALRHPNVVRFLDAQVASPPFYVVSEWLPARRLSELLIDELPDWNRAIQIARDIAAAVHAIHKLGFVHAALQPSAISITRQGRAVITDLSFAHRPDELSDCTFADDWYSFGTIMNELTDGGPTYYLEQIRQILKFRNPRLAAMKARSADASWRSLVERLTQTDASRRPIGFEVIQALSRLDARPTRILQAA